MFDIAFSWSWLTLIALGSFHGLNPAMGWLFAVALGIQERRVGAPRSPQWPAQSWRLARSFPGTS